VVAPASTAQSLSKPKTARESTINGAKKKIERQPVKETRPKVLERLAKKLAQKERKAARREALAQGVTLVKGENEAVER